MYKRSFLYRPFTYIVYVSMWLNNLYNYIVIILVTITNALCDIQKTNHLTLSDDFVFLINLRTKQ